MGSTKADLREVGGSEFEELQPHIKCRQADIAPYVFLPGDPARARRIADHLEGARKVAEHREFLVFTGHYAKVPMSVCSTGIGAPSAAIAIEELGKIGAHSFIRVGSAGGMQPDVNPGDIVIVSAAYRGEGTSRHYLPVEFPAVADLEVTEALRQGANTLGFPVRVGIASSGDAFYAAKPEGHVELLRQAGVLAGEMECSILYIIAALRGWKAGAVVAIDGNIYRRQRKTAASETQFREAEEKAIQIAFEAVKILNR